jgi:hypothetical protein
MRRLIISLLLVTGASTAHASTTCNEAISVLESIYLGIGIDSQEIKDLSETGAEANAQLIAHRKRQLEESRSEISAAEGEVRALCSEKHN